MVEISDGNFTLPIDLWGNLMPIDKVGGWWKKSVSVLYEVVKPAPLRKNHLYTLHRAYISPEKLSKIKKGEVIKCLKCGSVGATDVHMFWDCPSIRLFWEEVCDTVSAMLGR
ncbi:hypothetical protein NDU88_011498 [Pleurodeles waltl]|uniref:Reverse transcriptase zinc-binding domain-containing protein n=1 Tax=Pleurodeles waltl TaxID=8319 RepID=A0AAV7PYL5_PLEWA|nr:hypothetical protein NDU88_011498 [Pleurodeles waltl]